jgi:hypothetical protein
MISRIPEKELLKSFQKFYNLLLEKTTQTFNSGNYEKTLEMVSTTAHFAWYYHTGVFSESKLDDIILKIGSQLESLTSSDVQPVLFSDDKTGLKKRILHVASELHDVGGHSRLIKSWIENDSANHHSLIITNQEDNKFPVEFAKSMNVSGGQVIMLPKSESLLNRAGILRKASQQFDFVILHIHPNDIIPLLALATENVPPVGLMNHADHAFWLGVSIVDLVIDLRSFGTNLTMNRRKGKKSLILPIPLLKASEEITREEARRQLSIQDDQVLIVSMGAEYKYFKNKSVDFSQTAAKLLDKNLQTQLYLIGPKFDKEKFRNHERMKFLGVVQNPIVYQKAADIYLEGFPFSSFTALLETVLLEVCPVLMYAPRRIGSFDVEMSLSKCEKNAATEDEYIAQVTKLINQPTLRRNISKDVKKDIADYHYGEAWQRYLGVIYNHLSSIKHHPELVNDVPCLSNQDDLYLVELKNNELQFCKYPIWLEICSELAFLKMLPFTDIVKTMKESFRIRDSKFLVDLIRWRHIFMQKRKYSTEG